MATKKGPVTQTSQAGVQVPQPQGPVTSSTTAVQKTVSSSDRIPHAIYTMPTAVTTATPSTLSPGLLSHMNPTVHLPPTVHQLSTVKQPPTTHKPSSGQLPSTTHQLPTAPLPTSLPPIQALGNQTMQKPPLQHSPPVSGATAMNDRYDTNHSVVDMELLENTSMQFMTSALPTAPHSSTVNFPAAQSSVSNFSVQLLMDAVSSNHQNVMTTLSRHAMEMRKEMDVHTRQVTNMSVKGAEDMKHMLRQQLDYVRTELTATLNWRLKYHHAEVLKDLNTVLAPLATSLHEIHSRLNDCSQQLGSLSMNANSWSPLQANLGHCTQRLDGLALDIAQLKSTMEVGGKTPNVSAQTNPSSPYVCTTDDQCPAAQLPSDRPPLQSTMNSGPSFCSPDDPNVSRPPRGPYTGKKPIKIQFPFFGRAEDTSDPLLYLEKCHDYLALHPLSDEELLATLRNVLHGTARDWWDVARADIAAWSAFERSFLSAFLSENYEDELAERVRTRVQRENESIRDFAYMYRALCKRWKPAIQEEEVIKLILKNINPQLASQLRSNGVKTVDGLVRLGQQLERDKENQRQYEQKIQSAPQPRLPNPAQSLPSTSKPPQPYCWRCKGSHAPASCSQMTSSHKKPYKSSPPQPGSSAADTQAAVSVGHDNLTDDSLPSGTLSVPLQLTVPLKIESWKGPAMLDTGSSYTLLNEKLWLNVRKPNDELKPWTTGPIYLADGGAREPLGWGEVELTVQAAPVILPVAVLGAQTLAFPVVLGLDYIFFTGLQVDVRNNVYWFQPHERFSFLQEGASLKEWHPSVALFSAMAPHPLCADETDLIGMACRDACLEGGERQQLMLQLKQNSDVCTNALGQTNVLSHKIYVSHEVPIRQKPYRASPVKQKIMDDLIQEMLKAGVIEPSSSAWASPVVLIPKKTGGYRFCVDYRKLNLVTQTDAYPIPTIQEILESLTGAVVFSTLDLNSGYWQVRMDGSSTDKTAFISRSGLYHFKVMPFGLKNAPASFQRLMEKVLGELRGKICFVYLDDIIIYSASIEQHFLDVQAVLDKLRKAHLTVNMKKTHFFRPSLKFLGHVVSATGIAVDPAKTQAVQEFPVPRNLKELQRFLGMAGWYHRFVPNFSKLADPLNALKRKGAKFTWTPECQASFDALKQYLVSPPILGHPNLSLPFTVYTDASDVGLGAVLVQRTDSGSEEILAFGSRALNSAERNYSATEKECLAVVWSLEKWRYYLEGRHFTVVTDHSSLIWVFKTQKPSTRLIRWALRLQEFSFSVEYRKGKYNTVPDALSRAPTDHIKPTALTCAAVMPAQKEDREELPITDDVLWQAQQSDPEIMKVYDEILTSGDVDVSKVTRFTIIEDKVFRVVTLPHKIQYQAYIPENLRTQLLEFFHAHPLSGHLGRFKTYKRIHALAYWPNLSVDVKNFVQNCHTCPLYKPECRRPPGKLEQTIVSRPWEMLGVDLMGPLPRSSSNNVHLLVFVDYYSRWVELFPLRTATAETVSRVLIKEILTRWGVPDYLLSDRGSQFVSDLFQTVCRQWGLKHKMTTAYHPQTNMTERVNRTLKTMISSYVGNHHKHWDKHLHEFRFALNTAVSESTGVTPAEVNLNRLLRGPLDMLLQPPGSSTPACSPESPVYKKAAEMSQMKNYVDQKLIKAREKQKAHYDKTRRDVLYEEQDRVWMRSHPYSKAEKAFSAKLAPKWQGPYRIVRQLTPLNYEIVLEETGEDLRVTHVSRLKPCYPTAKEVEDDQRSKVLQLFLEESEDDEFLGFHSTQSDDVKSSLLPVFKEADSSLTDCLAQRKRVWEILAESSDDEDFQGFLSEDLD